MNDALNLIECPFSIELLNYARCGQFGYAHCAGDLSKSIMMNCNASHVQIDASFSYPDAPFVHLIRAKCFKFIVAFCVYHAVICDASSSCFFRFRWKPTQLKSNIKTQFTHQIRSAVWGSCHRFYHNTTATTTSAQNKQRLFQRPDRI